MGNVTDDVLLRRAADGDEAAFLLLYERHRDIILRFAYRFLGSMSAAEDVAHDAFLRALRNPDRFDSARASFRTYLCAIARHVALTQRRHDRVIAVEGSNSDLAVRIFSPREPLSQLLDDELSSVVQRAMLQLPAAQREVVILFEYEDLSLAEVAAIVGVGIGAVKARLHRARERLRRELAPYLSAEARPSLGKRKRETR